MGGAEWKVVMTRVYLGEDNERARVSEREREGVRIDRPHARLPQPEQGDIRSAARLLALSCAASGGSYAKVPACA